MQLIFKGATKIQNGRKCIVGAKTHKLKSEIIQILQSHYPLFGNVQVILLKFKMATTTF